jgi:hypothetical protein
MIMKVSFVVSALSAMSVAVDAMMLNEFPFLMAHDAASGYLERDHVGK